MQRCKKAWFCFAINGGGFVRENMVLDVLERHERFVIYGAQVVAVGAMEAISHLARRRPECFAVGKPKDNSSDLGDNPAEIDGIPVCPIEDVPKEMFIIVGVTELVQKEVLPYLSEQGYVYVYPLTQHEEHLLMSRYYQSIGMFLPA